MKSNITNVWTRYLGTSTVFPFNSIEKYKRIYIKPDSLQFSRKGVNRTVVLWKNKLTGGHFIFIQFVIIANGSRSASSIFHAYLIKKKFVIKTIQE